MTGCRSDLVGAVCPWIARYILFTGIALYASPASAQITSVLVPSSDAVPAAKTGAAVKSPRGMLVIGGSTFPSVNFTVGGTKLINEENASFSTALQSKSGFGASASAGVAVWRRLGVRAGFSTYSAPVDGAFQAAVPHPFYFNKPRALSGATTGLKRQESALDLHVAALVAAGQRITLMVSAGPTLLRLEQGVATDFVYRDAYPYDSATLASVSTSAVTGSKNTIGGTLTLGFFLTKSVGVAAGVHFASANIPIDVGTNTSVKIGGAHGTVSVAARF